MGTLIKPEKVSFDSADDKDKLGNLVSNELSGQIIPLGTVLKVFFEFPSIFYSIHEYYVDLQNNRHFEIQNIVQTDYWKSKVSESDAVQFPLFLYEDGFKTGNCLGLHAGTYNLNGRYILIPCIPPAWYSYDSSVTHT